MVDQVSNKSKREYTEITRISTQGNQLNIHSLPIYLSFKGTEIVISSDPPYREANARFTTVPFKHLTVHRVKRALC